MAVPSNNIVNTKTTYDIIFTTATTGTINEIHVTFPSIIQPPTTLIERVGIGPGILTVKGQEMVYAVSSPVNIPSGTTIRLEVGNIQNVNTPGNAYSVSVITKAGINI